MSQKFPEYYWNWIELRPTSGADVLAEYKPYHKKGSNGVYIDEEGFDYGDNKTFRLNDVANLAAYPGNGNNAENGQDKTERWYTVFVNEYTYETELDESNNNWVDYVNKPPRMCWLNTVVYSAKDQESNYIRSKYAIRQQSIQTFYDVPDQLSKEDREGLDIDALGVEHVNETFGFNLRWSVSNITFVNNNGRHNEWNYLSSSSSRNTNKSWSAYLTQEKLQKIEDINKQSYQYNLTNDLSEGPYYVPAIYTYSSNENKTYTNHNINSRNFLRILDACMNRNRDNDGDGVIDMHELRWYVPASSEILDIVLGRNSMESPLMDYANNQALTSPNTNLYQKHHANTRFHYATSNNRVLWAEEGVTINPESDNIDDGWNLPPQQIRCVRALGTNLRTDNTNDLSPAFTVDNSSQPTKIYPTYYDSKNMRSYSPTALQPHQETSTLNRLCYDGFEFKKELIEFVGKGEWIQGAWWNNSLGHMSKYQWQDTDYSNYPQYNWWNDTYVDNWINLYRYPDETTFIDQHDDVLAEASRRCQEENGGPEWRIPNMKEAALIKLALDNSRTYKTARTFNPNANPRPYEKEVKNGYEIGSFLTGTYREFGIDGDESRTRKTGYYTSIYYPEAPGTDDYDANGHMLGRIHCVSTGYQQHYYIRCVRDLQSTND